MKYTNEQTQELIKLWDNGNGSSVAEIATHFEVPERSVIAKLASLKLYTAKPYTNKRGEPPIKKEEYIDKIAALLDKDASLLDSIEKANKNVLILILKGLEAKQE